MAGSKLLSVAPMMDVTDVQFRHLARLLSRHTWLYSEMVVDQTIRHNPVTDRFLWYPPEQHPIACQLGGSNPSTLREAAQIVAQYGYDEVNLNCGCPSDRVAGAGCFGAALMLQPEAVANCMAALREATDVAVTVKCRLGVDQADSYEELCNFIKIVSEGSDVRHFIIHARKCLLKGLSPHQNRTIPPLRYGWIHALIRDFPDLEFSLNGGVKTCEDVRSILDYRSPEGRGVRSVMVGRAAYDNPWNMLGKADTMIFGAESNPAANRRQVLKQYGEFADEMYGKWSAAMDGSKKPSMRVLIKPLLNLFHGEKGTKQWKRALDAHLLEGCQCVSELLQKSMSGVPDSVLDAPPAAAGKGVDYCPGEQPEPCVRGLGNAGLENGSQREELVILEANG